MSEPTPRALLMDVLIGLDAYSDDEERSEWTALIDAIEAAARQQERDRILNHFRAFLAEVDVAHGFGPAKGQSHSPCGICRAMAHAREFFAAIESDDAPEVTR